jgi:hypothetical protein
MNALSDFKRRSIAVLSGLLLAACGAPPGMDEDTVTEELDPSQIADDGMLAQGAALTPTVFDPNRLLEDSDITGHQWITVAQVQGFLQQQRSYLANYRDPAWGNKTAAQIIVERSTRYNISPLYMLGRLDTESSIISSGTSNKINQACGCGCPDGSVCSPQYSGFGNQIECSASWLRGYLTDLDAGRATIAGWKNGLGKNTFDPCWVTPANKATAALYTYTPWVGAYSNRSCGRWNIGGSTLVALKYHRFKDGYAWGSGPPPAGSCYSGTTDSNVINGACVQSASDALWRQCTNGAFSTGSATAPTNCTATYGYCQSGTLGFGVPVRTCVQARSDSQWYQCGANSAFVSASSAGSTGTGPAGTCAKVYAL